MESSMEGSMDAPIAYPILEFFLYWPDSSLTQKIFMQLFSENGHIRATRRARSGPARIVTARVVPWVVLMGAGGIPSGQRGFLRQE